MELNSLIRLECYKQAAPLGLKEKQITLQLQGRVRPKGVKFTLFLQPLPAVLGTSLRPPAFSSNYGGNPYQASHLVLHRPATHQ
ncbi:MAG: hypothetical protein HW390_267 [Candidatus Brocadiaceae bacterium]|nr:hypothetical protein [Candidatus Brocadiaceae bacterium]